MAQQRDGGGGAGGLAPSPEVGMGGGVGGGEATPSEPASAPSFFSLHLDQAQAKFNAVRKEVSRIHAIRKGLDALGRLGDAVTSDDVLDEMSDLVAHGADPKMFAAMMSGSAGQGVPPMPPQGEALAGWLGQVSEELLAPYEAQLRPAMALAGHQLGVAAMHRMVDLGAAKGGAPEAPPAPPPSSPLTSPASTPVANTAAPSLLQ